MFTQGYLCHRSGMPAQEVSVKEHYAGSAELAVMVGPAATKSRSTGSSESAGRMWVVLPAPALLPRLWRGTGVASGAWGPGLTSESADAARAVLRDDLSAGPQVYRTRQRCPPDLPGLGRGPGSQLRRPAGACHPFTREKRWQ